MPLKHDLGQNYALKDAIEDLLGKEAWLELKETTSIVPWRRQADRLISAIEKAVAATVKSADATWFEDIGENLTRGRAAVKAAKEIEELTSALTAMLLRQVFLQLGLMPNRKTSAKVSLDRSNWKLDAHRSVFYVQSPEQIESQFWAQQSSRFSFQEKMELKAKHRASGTKLSYSAWCRENDF